MDRLTNTAALRLFELYGDRLLDTAVDHAVAVAKATGRERELLMARVLGPTLAASSWRLSCRIAAVRPSVGPDAPRCPLAYAYSAHDPTPPATRSWVI